VNLTGLKIILPPQPSLSLSSSPCHRHCHHATHSPTSHTIGKTSQVHVHDVPITLVHAPYRSTHPQPRSTIHNHLHTHIHTCTYLCMYVRMDVYCINMCTQSQSESPDFDPLFSSSCRIVGHPTLSQP
jgi:hypothetical protein